MNVLARLKKLTEAGARNSANDQKHIQAAHDSMVSAGATCAPMKESASFSNNDVMSILNSEIKEDIDPNAYILDVFATNLVYSVGYEWSVGGSSSWQIDYTVTDGGDVTWGTPIEVVRKVTYVPMVEAPEPIMGESARTTDLPSNAIELVEKAVKSDGTVMLKLISPGLGSSAYYPADVLKRDGPNVFKKGLHNLIDHPTPQEESARPEGSIANLGSTLKEDAKWYEDYKGFGPGLYAMATATPDFTPKLNVIAQDIGMSIRAVGTSRMGDIDGKQVPIVESITRAKSVDYVTLPGRGGAIVDLLESKRTGDAEMPIDEKLFQEVQAQNRALVEQVSQLQQYNMRNEARNVIAQTLGNYPTLAAVTRTRVAQLAESAVPPVDSTTGALDAVKLVESVKNLISAEMAYLSSLGQGQVRGLGAGASFQESDTAKLAKQIEDNLAALA